MTTAAAARQRSRTTERDLKPQRGDRAVQGGGARLVAEAERLFPRDTVLAVLEALRYDVSAIIEHAEQAAREAAKVADNLPELDGGLARSRRP